MRKIVMFNRVSAEGFFATPDERMDWAPPEPELDRQAAQGAPSADTFLFGRRTYELFASFWPHAVDQSPTSPDPHDAGRRSEDLRKLAVALNEGTKLVFSRTLKQLDWKNSRLLTSFDPKQIEALKREPGKDMMVMGSGSIVSQLTEHGLIDEYWIVVGPLFLGRGRPLMRDVTRSLKLDLLEAKAFPQGNVLLRYAPKR
jgi:dihydrofolate reductase